MKNFFLIVSMAAGLFIGIRGDVQAADIEAVLDDAAGAGTFSVKDSGSVEGAHIDSDGNMVIKGGLRLDSSGVENTTAENLIVDGSVGIGDTTPASALTVGNGDLFQVNSSGDVVKLKNISYVWPGSQGGASTVLANDGSGNLSWSSSGTGSAALSGIIAATTANTIGSGDNAQVWNWVLSTADKAGFTFGESSASTATGTPSILKASTLATSTAIPLYSYNLGAGLSFRVDDEASDTTPFVVDASGNVGIGTTNPLAILHTLKTGSGDVEVARFSDTTADGNPYITLGKSSASNQGAYIMYRGTENALTMAIHGDSFGTGLTLIDGGNVGIGTTNPQYNLHISSSASNNTQLYVESGPTGDRALFGLKGHNASNNNDEFAFNLKTDLAQVNLSSYDASATTWVSLLTHKYTLATPEIDFGSNKLYTLGNVGIGTTSPGAALEVVSTAWPATIVKSSYTTGTALNIVNTATNGSTYKLLSTGSGASPGGGKFAILDTNDNYRMLIDNQGNVGIGTTDPNQKMEVSGAVGITGPSIDTGTNNLTLSYESYGGRIQSWNGKVLSLNPLGNNVGIGTTSPGAKLHSYTTDSTDQLLIERYGGTAGTRGKLAILHSNFGYSGGTGADTILDADWGLGIRVNKQSGTPTLGMLITNNGNVGIGATVPNTKLEILDGATVAKAVPLFVRNGMLFATDNNWRSRIGFGTGDNATVLTDIAAVKSIAGDNSKVDLRFSTWNSGFQEDVVTFRYNGNVGIGTTSPLVKFHTSGASSNAAAWMLEDTSGPVDKKRLRFIPSGGVVKVDVPNDAFTGADTLMSWDLNNLRVGLGYDSPGTAKLAINGNVGIGTTSPTSALHVVGLSVYANNAAAVAGGLTAGAFYRTGGDPDPVCVVH